MGYITTDFWANYPQIWLEPMYILVTAWNAQPPANNRLMNPTTMKRDRPDLQHRPAERVLQPVLAGLLRRGAGRHAADEVHVGEAAVRRSPGHAPGAESIRVDRARRPVAAVGRRHLDDRAVARRVADRRLPGARHADFRRRGPRSQSLTGWLDGASVSYVDFGPDNFDVGAGQVIQDVPLFLFKHYDDNGKLMLAGAPNVGGVAPLFSHVPGRLSDSGRPQFGALWRLHIVTLPPTAGVFTADKTRRLRSRAARIAAIMNAKVLRVALEEQLFHGHRRRHRHLRLARFAAGDRRQPGREGDHADQSAARLSVRDVQRHAGAVRNDPARLDGCAWCSAWGVGAERAASRSAAAARAAGRRPTTAARSTPTTPATATRPPRAAPRRRRFISTATSTSASRTRRATAPASPLATCGCRPTTASTPSRPR